MSEYSTRNREVVKLTAPRTTQRILNPTCVNTTHVLVSPSSPSPAGEDSLLRTAKIKPPTLPPAYREMTIVLSPVLGPRVDMNDVATHPNAVKHRMVATAWGKVRLKYSCASTPIGTVVRTALTENCNCSYELPYALIRARMRMRRTHINVFCATPLGTLSDSGTLSIPLASTPASNSFAIHPARPAHELD